MVLEQYAAEAVEAKRAELTAQLQEFEAVAREQARARVEAELGDKRAAIEVLQSEVVVLEAELATAMEQEEPVSEPEEEVV